MHGAGATVADPVAGWGRGQKHEIYVATFGKHLFYNLFLQGQGAIAPMAPPGSATVLRSSLLGQDHLSSKGHISNIILINRLWPNCRKKFFLHIYSNYLYNLKDIFSEIFNVMSFLPLDLGRSWHKLTT